MESDRPALSPRAALLDVALVLGGFIALRALAERAGLYDALGDRVPRFALLAHVAFNAVVALALVSIALAARHARLRDIGAGRTRVGPALGWGLLTALAAYLVQLPIVAVLATLSHGRAQRIAAERSELLQHFTQQPAWLIPLVAIVAGVYEEVLVRGFSLTRLRTFFGALTSSPRTRDALAVLASSAVFGLAHAYQGPLGVLQTFLAGVLLASLTVWRGTIWAAVVAHATIDGVSLFTAQVIVPVVRKALEQRGH